MIPKEKWPEPPESQPPTPVDAALADTITPEEVFVEEDGARDGELSADEEGALVESAGEGKGVEENGAASSGGELQTPEAKLKIPGSWLSEDGANLSSEKSKTAANSRKRAPPTPEDATIPQKARGSGAAAKSAAAKPAAAKPAAKRAAAKRAAA